MDARCTSIMRLPNGKYVYYLEIVSRNGIGTSNFITIESDHELGFVPNKSYEIDVIVNGEAKYYD